MPTTTIDGHHIQVDAEGFMTEPMEWTDELAKTLAAHGVAHDVAAGATHRDVSRS